MIAVLSQSAPQELFQALQARGHTPLPLPPHPALPKAVASHPDMLLFFAEHAIFTTRDYYCMAKKELDTVSAAAQKELRFVRKALSADYPNDVLLNALPMGNRLICNAKHTAQEILEATVGEIIDVRQGYCKCNAVPISDDALLTSDPSIAKKASDVGLDVLRLREGFVALPPYSTGFLGGASDFSPYAKRTEICFSGNLELHPDKERIAAFCAKYHREPVSLCKTPLLDIGTIFLL